MGRLVACRGLTFHTLLRGKKWKLFSNKLKEIHFKHHIKEEGEG